MVPETGLESTTDGAVPEQIVCEEGVAVATGVGFTVTVTVIGEPEHPFAEGVMEYTAVPATVPELVITCAMLEPEPADAPETPVSTTVHE